jgi:hypothetical protein
VWRGQVLDSRCQHVLHLRGSWHLLPSWQHVSYRHSVPGWQQMCCRSDFAHSLWRRHVLGRRRQLVRELRSGCGFLLTRRQLYRRRLALPGWVLLGRHGRYCLLYIVVLNRHHL